MSSAGYSGYSGYSTYRTFHRGFARENTGNMSNPSNLPSHSDLVTRDTPRDTPSDTTTTTTNTTQEDTMSKTIPFNCSQCGHKIGPRSVHVYVPETKSVWCLDCFSPSRTGSRGVHARIYTDCPFGRHDMYDHLSASGDRAFMALWLSTTTVTEAAL